ncbi:MAG: hypothetical protein OEV74_07140 [Cyclobacteriaceae bacterium]|nr:hypothetical protein [Cyclobacteriaceae bacterium]MDH4296035.1 hypothetical protein [Cyclobacteriaceae bacterium]MDH5249803.1 hypothetical protein [Cyclobacteriaceae bacterium]
MSRQGVTKKYHIGMLVMLWAGVQGALFWHFGVRILYDSAEYIKAAQQLRSQGRLADIFDIFYSIPIFFLSLSGGLFAQPVIPFLFFQCILSGFAALALFYSGVKIFDNSWSGFLSGAIYLLWWDNIQWNTTVMTESMLCSISCLVIYLLSHFKGSRREYLLLVVVAIITLFTRPTGIIIIAGVIAFLVQYHWHLLAAHKVVKFSFFAGLACFAYCCANLIFLHWDFTDQYKRGNIVTYMDTMQGTSLYYESLRLDVTGMEFGPDKGLPLFKIVYFIVHNPRHFLASASLKMWYLMSGVRPYYSTVHNSFLLVWMSLMYLLFYLGWRRSHLMGVNIFCLTVIISNCALISIATVDWDNRFYIPMESGIVILAGGGAMSLMEIVKRKFTNRSAFC